MNPLPLKFKLSFFLIWLERCFADAMLWVMKGALFGVGFMLAVAWIAKG